MSGVLGDLVTDHRERNLCWHAGPWRRRWSRRVCGGPSPMSWRPDRRDRRAIGPRRAQGARRAARRILRVTSPRRPQNSRAGRHERSKAPESCEPLTEPRSEQHVVAKIHAAYENTAAQAHSQPRYPGGVMARCLAPVSPPAGRQHHPRGASVLCSTRRTVLGSGDDRASLCAARFTGRGAHNHGCRAGHSLDQQRGPSPQGPGCLMVGSVSADDS